MRFNAQRFWRVFALLTILECLLLCVGCSSTWLTAVSGLLPSIAAIANTVLAFIAGLQGKTVSPATQSAIQKWQANVAQLVSDAQTLITQIQQNASATLISQLQTAMTTISGEFNSILSSVDITDSATVAKLTQFLSLGIAAVNAVLAFIPMVAAKLAAKAPMEELRHYDAIAGGATMSSLKVVKETYKAIVETPTGEPEVDAVLGTLPAELA